jgi:hypothetical protein
MGSGNEGILKRLVGEVGRRRGDEGDEVVEVVPAGGAGGQGEEDGDGVGVGEGGLAVLRDEEAEDLAEVGDEGGEVGEAGGGEEGGEVLVQVILRGLLLCGFYNRTSKVSFPKSLTEGPSVYSAKSKGPSPPGGWGVEAFRA